MQSSVLGDQPSAVIASAMTRLAMGSLSTSTPSQSKIISSRRAAVASVMNPPFPGNSESSRVCRPGATMAPPLDDRRETER